MAVKASATITLTSYRDTQSVTRYYKLQPAGSSAPLKPETKPPSSDWTDSEPACDISKELYFCDLTIFSNGEGEYSKVSKSTSYEAAKQAYNKAQSASDTASAAKDSIDNLEVGGRNLFLNTGVAVTWDDYLITSYKHANEPLKEGEIYTATICVTPAENLTQIRVYFSLGYTTPVRFYPKGTGKQVISGTFTMAYYDGRTPDVDPSYAYAQLYRFPNDGTVTGNTTVHWFKIEKGNKATDWTPAPEDVDAGIANTQTGVDSLNDAVFGVKTFEYILDGVTIPAHKREDGTYYYILNDEEVTVTEADLVHDADGELTSYQDGSIYDDLDNIAVNIEAIDTKINGFDAREDSIYASIEQNSLIARNYARFNGQSLIITNESETEKVEDLNNYLQLNSDSIVIHSNKNPSVAIGVIDDTSGNKSGYMEMKGTSLFIAQESRLSTIRLRSVEKIGKLALVAGSDGHVSLKEVLD